MENYALTFLLNSNPVAPLDRGSIGQHKWPKFVIVPDFEYLRLTKLGEDSWAQTFTVDELPDRIDQLIFLAGQETITTDEE